MTSSVPDQASPADSLQNASPNPPPTSATHSATQSPKPAAGAASGKWLRRAAWLVGGFVALAAASWFLVPPILKSQLEKAASAQLGRTLTVGKIDFKPWNLQLSVDDLAIAKANNSGPQLQIKRIFVDASLQSLRRLAPVVDAIAVDGLHLNLTHLGGGKYDVDDIIAKVTAPSDQPKADAGPPGFALYNLALNGASMDFNDQSVGKTHTVRSLTLGVPFLSNLPGSREVKTEPHLAFQVNGSAFDSRAATTPFTDSHKTDASLRIAALDLKPYLAYLPAGLPVQLVSAVLNADVKVAFEQGAKTAVRLSGTVGAGQVVVRQKGPQNGAQKAPESSATTPDLLAFDTLKVAFDDVRPLEQVAKLTLVELQSPRLAVSRDRAGQVNLQFDADKADGSPARAAKPAKPAKDATESIANNADSTRAKGGNDEVKSAWKLSLDKFSLKGGQVVWTDATTAPSASVVAEALDLEASALAWPFAQPLQFSGSTSVSGGAVVAAPKGASPGAAGSQAKAAGPANSGASLSFSGSATDQLADVKASLGSLPLSIAAPYLAQFLQPRLAGQLNAELAVQWTPASLKVGAPKLTLADVALLPNVGQAAGQSAGKAVPANALASLKKLELADTLVDLDKRSVTVGKVALIQPQAAVSRDAQGHWMYEDWLKPAPVAGGTGAAAPGPARASSANSPTEPGKPWSVNLADLQLDGGTVHFLDQAMPKPVALEVSGVKVSLKAFELHGKKAMPLVAALKLRMPQGEPGQLDYKGNLGLDPLSADGDLLATQVPVHAFEPYFGQSVNVDLVRADAGFKGRVRFASAAAGATVKVTGDALLEEFRARTLAGAGAAAPSVATPAGSSTSAQTTAAGAATSTGAAEELLSWKALSVRGLDVALAPGTATTVNVSETALTDFFARVLVSESGRINLQDLMKQPGAAGPADATKSGAVNADSARVNGQSNQVKPPPEAAQAAVSAAPAGPEAVINIGPVSLINGKVFFSDHFIRPNYSANLSELNGRLSAFSNAPGAASTAQPALPPMADLELRGRAEGTASLEVLGKLNPLAKPLALDLKAKVRDLELPPLSPYSVKYAGYGIERGKLSVDLAYVVKPDGQLDASNNIILNQLKFGEKVEGAPNSLPVKLAVALLADRNGVIDIDLPVSGSLNDPQFSLGPVIFKVIINLVLKAVIAPFSLLASAFGGGGDELSQVSFAAGSAVLSAEAQAGLDKVAKALVERPALKMTVVVTSNLEVEREAYKQEKLTALLQGEKRRAQVVGGQGGAVAAAPAAGASAAVTSPPPAVAISAAERPALIREVYRRSDMPKPRNLIGIAKDIPLEEMEALLLANIAVTEDVMRDLAVQRGVAVKDYLAGKQLPVERLFLGNAKAADSAGKASDAGAKASDGGAVAKADAKWTPRAELNLATN